MNTTINFCKSDSEILECGTVMLELRPHIRQEDFLNRVRLQEKGGFSLLCLKADGRPVAAAGIRIITNLAWGTFLYVDDLVTLDAERSRGYGAQLLKWLHDYAREQKCDQLHLDSGTWRKDAHRFYDREGMEMTSYHYASKLG